MPNYKNFTKPSDWLGVLDFESTPVIPVTIQKWAVEEVKGHGGKASNCLVLYWSESSVKKFIPSDGTAAQIAGVAGSEDVDQWIGVALELYVEHGFVMPNKSKIDVVRARAPKPKSVEFTEEMLDTLIDSISADTEKMIPQVINKIINKTYVLTEEQAERLKEKFPTLKF